MAQQLGITTAGPWEYHAIASPAPGTFNDGDINGNYYLNIYSAGYDAFGEGFVDGWSVLFDSGISKQVPGTYYEEWEYIGDKVGDIEGSANLYIYGVASTSAQGFEQQGASAFAQATGYLIWNTDPDPLNGDQNVFLDSSCSERYDSPTGAPTNYNWVAPFSGTITVTGGAGQEVDQDTATAYYGQDATNFFVECKSLVFIILYAKKGEFWADANANALVDGYQNGNYIVLGEHD